MHIDLRQIMLKEIEYSAVATQVNEEIAQLLHSCCTTIKKKQKYSSDLLATEVSNFELATLLHGAPPLKQFVS